MLKKVLTLIILFLLLAKVSQARERFFQIQAVDTMKFSRDMARSKGNSESFEKTIETQVKNIAGVGATHVAIGTPYEEEFIPFLKKWVAAARKYKLKVWFRGNLAGWEKWFDYPKITENNHKLKIREFIVNNPDLFEDGDVFTSCPECENGGPGDPRATGKVKSFRSFLSDEYVIVKDAFKSIDKNVIANYYSMNGDVARLIMDEETTKKLDGAVTIDHYVESSERMENDIKELAQISGGKIVLGEFGAPIPDIHGVFTEKQQADWVDDALSKVVRTRETIAINYWTAYGSSTNLWNDDDRPRKVVSILEKYYKPVNLVGLITDENEKPIREVTVRGLEKTYVIADGKYEIPVLDGESVTFSKNGYTSLNIRVRTNGLQDVRRDIVLVDPNRSRIYTIVSKIVNFLIGLMR